MPSSTRNLVSNSSVFRGKQGAVRPLAAGRGLRAGPRHLGRCRRHGGVHRLRRGRQLHRPGRQHPRRLRDVVVPLARASLVMMDHAVSTEPRLDAAEGGSSLGVRDGGAGPAVSGSQTCTVAMIRWMIGNSGSSVSHQSSRRVPRPGPWRAPPVSQRNRCASLVRSARDRAG